MKKYTNEKDISLLMSVFLADDRYDYDPKENTISVTTLLKSVRQIILNSRLEPSESLQDISGLLSSRIGTAIHESVEKAWVENYQVALEALGYPKRVIEKIRINPSEPEEDTIPIWLEQRNERVLGNWVISGCADVIMEGMVRDIKSTKVWSYTSGAKERDYQLQLSLYRWIMSDLITEDTGVIEYIFTDHSPLKATYEQGYPEIPVLEKKIPLLSLEESESFIRTKLDQVDHYKVKAEADLPECTDEELWIRDSEWKYYASPDAKRATKNFKEDKAGAYAHLAVKGKGVVKEVKGKPMACTYCSAKPLCSQYQRFMLNGDI